MDPTNMPNGEHVEATKGVLEWIAYIASLAGVGWVAGRNAGKAESKATEALSDIALVKADVEKLQDAGFITREDLESKQRVCQEHTWDKLLLALEKRDREFDRKFSAICQGIGEIKGEIKARGERV